MTLRLFALTQRVGRALRPIAPRRSRLLIVTGMISISMTAGLTTIFGQEDERDASVRSLALGS